MSAAAVPELAPTPSPTAILPPAVSPAAGVERLRTLPATDPQLADRLVDLNPLVEGEGAQSLPDANVSAAGDFILGDTGDSFRLGQGGGMNVPGGDDVLTGGPDDDGLGGENGNDTLKGGEGDDFATGQTGAGNVSGDDGNDDLFGGPADDVVNGGDGNDNLTGNFGNDTPLGGKGDDTLFGDAFFDDPGAFDVCNGQQGFDLSATCEVNNQRQPEQGHTARARLVGLATWVSARCSQPCAASRTAFRRGTC